MKVIWFLFISVVNRSDDIDGRLKGNYQPFIQCILRENSLSKRMYNLITYMRGIRQTQINFDRKFETKCTPVFINYFSHAYRTELA